jgi:hypothetical protein
MLSRLALADDRAALPAGVIPAPNPATHSAFLYR